MGKKKKQKKKELLEQQLLKYQKIECLANILLAVITIISVIVTASEKNLERLKSECLHIFDDKSTRNEMLVDKAREIFEEE